MGSHSCQSGACLAWQADLWGKDKPKPLLVLAGFVKVQARVARGASSNQRHIRLHKSGNEVHIFMRGPRVVGYPIAPQQSGEEAWPPAKADEPERLGPNTQNLAVVVTSVAREVGNV